MIKLAFIRFGGCNSLWSIEKNWLSDDRTDTVPLYQHLRRACGAGMFSSSLHSTVGWHVMPCLFYSCSRMRKQITVFVASTKWPERHMYRVNGCTESSWVVMCFFLQPIASINGHQCLWLVTETNGCSNEHGTPTIHRLPKGWVYHVHRNHIPCGYD